MMLKTLYFYRLIKRNSLATTSWCCYHSGCLPESTLHTPRRAVLYVPGDSIKKIDKARSLGADCVVLDCEDGVSATSKDHARTTIAETLSSNSDFGASEVAVRINSISSGLAEKDLDIIFNSAKPTKTLVVPKLDTSEQAKWLGDKLAHCGRGGFGLNVITMMESPESLLNLRQICSDVISTLTRVSGHLVGIIFGSDDFCAAIGATRSPGGTELLYARQKLVTVCKYFKIQAIDMVHIDYKDSAGLRQYSLEGAAMGFTGKQVIHPNQISVVQDCFAPSVELVAWAEQVIDAFERHKEEGTGAFVFNDQMIDKPSILQAENIKALSDTIKLRKR